MRPVTLPSLAAVAASAPVVLDYRSSNPIVGLQLIVSGSNTSSVQVTDDDVFSPLYVASAGNWFALPNAAAFAGATTSQIGSFSVTGYTALRLNMTAYVSGGAVLKVISNSTLGV